MLTHGEIELFLWYLRGEYGFGHSDAKRQMDKETVSIGTLQAKLSIMLELAAKSRTG